MQSEPTRVLILYFSRHGHVEKLARLVARGVEQAGAEVLLRSVPAANASMSAPEATLSDLAECDALIVGSPTRFGSMASHLQAFFEATSPLWLSGALVGKPAAAFTSTATAHGGNEATLLDLLRPLLHHGMLIVGLPYSESGLQRTIAGGSPYGASSVSGVNGDQELGADARELSIRLGRRVAEIAVTLKLGRTRSESAQS